MVIVLSSDQPLVSEKTLKNIISTHAEKNPTITIATVSIPNFEDWRIGLNHFGRIIRDNNGKIKKIVEFKDATEEEKKIKELNPALYAFDADWLWKNITKLKNENVQKEYDCFRRGPKTLFSADKRNRKFYKRSKNYNNC